MLIAIAVYDTPENQRQDFTRRTIASMLRTVNRDKHRIVLVDNASSDPNTQQHLLAAKMAGLEVISLDKNYGTAAAINKAWALRQPGQHCCKADNDIEIDDKDWPDLLEEVFARGATIGVAALKRKDLGEHPNHPDERWRTRLAMLPKQAHERWIVIEQVFGALMGTCMAVNAALLDKIGYLYQMQDEGNLYGWDDSLYSVRSYLAGFASVFIPHIVIHHVDPGGTDYSKEKCEVAGKWLRRFEEVRQEYIDGKRPIYWEDKE